MKRYRLPIIALLLLLFAGSLAIPARAQANIQVVSDDAAVSFPETIQFSAEFQSAAKISSAVLQYGVVNQITCGTVQAEAFPEVTPGTDVKVQWSWEMRQSGSLPPGATVWWQWLVTTADGATFTSPKKTVLWMDNLFSWQSVEGGKITLHYYSGGANFANDLHTAAVNAAERLSTDIGIPLKDPVDIYIYADQADLTNSILYAPAWIGGQAIPENSIIILAIPQEQLDWGKGAEAHELTHILVHRFTYSCFSYMPVWLDEGMAMYGEGGPTAGDQDLFNQAKANNTLPSLQTLTGEFSAETTRAGLSYAEAYYVVNYMVSTYGKDKMLALLTSLKHGETMDASLQAVYGFDSNGLEAAFRKSINAPLPGSEQATPEPTPTIIPTIVPIGAAPVAPAAATTPHSTEVAPTPTQDSLGQVPPATAAPVNNPGGISLPKNLATILAIGGGCIIAALLLIGLPLFFVLRRRNRRMP